MSVGVRRCIANRGISYRTSSVYYSKSRVFQIDRPDVGGLSPERLNSKQPGMISVRKIYVDVPCPKPKNRFTCPNFREIRSSSYLLTAKLRVITTMPHVGATKIMIIQVPNDPLWSATNAAAHHSKLPPYDSNNSGHTHTRNNPPTIIIYRETIDIRFVMQSDNKNIAQLIGIKTIIQFLRRGDPNCRFFSADQNTE